MTTANQKRPKNEMVKIQKIYKCLLCKNRIYGVLRSVNKNEFKSIKISQEMLFSERHTCDNDEIGILQLIGFKIMG